MAFDKLSEEMYDIAGLRLMCQFVDDIDVVVNMLKARSDFEVVEERDYIKDTKESGYRSYHVIIKYPIETLSGQKFILAEIQIRTLAMNFWAT
ncbi:GTP pyrophosphokinase, partial [Staphylococcus aureus]